VTGEELNATALSSPITIVERTEGLAAFGSKDETCGARCLAPHQLPHPGG